MAEHVARNKFVVRDVTIHRRGTLASFLRRIEDAWAVMTRFFETTKRDYRRFNYIGEWHSHPRFEPVPSNTDHQSMRDIVSDPTVGANFVVLLILRLDAFGGLVGSVHTYTPNGTIEPAGLKILPNDT
jgi:integrative and conjugative element protein (TIGR02256 family)